MSWLAGALWSLATIALYGLAKRLHRRFQAWWSSPLLTAPATLLLAAASLHVGYRAYIGGTHWLVALLGPAVVAFAVPIHKRRALILRHGPLLLAGVIVGSLTSFASSLLLARWLGLDGTLVRSLLPRSMSTPFALLVSDSLGGVPALTAVFVLLTGVLGAALGDGVLGVLPLRTGLARGALFGMGAHGAGTARALQIDPEMGAIAGVVMVLVGLVNLAVAPFLGPLLRHLL
ncbi:murein hydrolase effector protein LrgB [Mesoterricola sediminis]|uniref:Murein hydrolase effector protein LrgB n=2 Tax=Mesoterricola sediminis TaxID=2927980 RepID=A0AA48KD33_9BACT|nr:murein hydrolase effector protein LrgB [Mesoterricola sediminis]